jgi:hypothetical protein
MRLFTKYGRNYEYTFAPTAKWKSMCILLHLAAVHDWNILSFDVENTYLEAKVDMEIYIKLMTYIKLITVNPSK